MTNNIVLDKGGSNQLTVYTTIVEEIMNNKITKVVPATGTANVGSGPKDTKLVNLLKITKLFIVDGKILSADRTKLKNIFDAGGTIVMEYSGTDYNISLEKISIKEEPEDAGSSNPEYYLIKMNCIIGVAI